MYHGDIRLGDTIDVKFTTRQISGAPSTLSGSPVISAYPGNSTTELTAGITLSVDFDSRTGLNNVRVVATSGNGYATATNYTLVITTGTVNSVSVVGECIGSFSIEARSALMPTTAARTLDVSATGEAGVDWANVGSPTTSLALTGTTIAVTQKVDVDTIKTNPVVNAGTVTFPTTATLASTTNITAGTVTTATNVTTVNGLAANVITATSINADAITAAKIADGAIDAATFAAGAINAAAIAADAITDAKVAADVTIASVTGAVGSVTGNVGGNVVGSVASVTAGVTVTTNNDKTGYALTAGERNSVADALLDRDMSTGTDSGSPTVRTPRQAMRFMRNKWSIAAGTLTVTKEDDSTASWTAAVTTNGTTPVDSVDPA
jgi:hypothetical protein